MKTGPSIDSLPLAWLFVDMNSFFASVEQQLRPELREMPVAVIPVESDGSCVIAASREAKRFGIKTGTGVREARVLCPGIRFVKARPAEYVRSHHAIAVSINRHALIHKAYSIDEWAIRLCKAQRGAHQAVELGQQIKAQILQDHGACITCSIGIAPTRLLAKIGSDLQKPDGMTVLEIRDLPDRFEGHSLQSLVGIGAGMVKRLESNGVRTIRDLWGLDRRQSVAVWGSVSGAQWWAGFHGIDEPEISTRRRSMSHSNVLEPRFRNEAGARGILTRLVCRLGGRLRSDGYLATALSVSVSDDRDEAFSSSLELPSVQDNASLLEAFYRLWKRREVGARPPWQVGAVVSGLVPVGQVAGNLFERADRSVRLSRTIDAIHGKWGLSSIYVGSMHHVRQPMDDKIAFGRIPSSREAL